MAVSAGEPRRDPETQRIRLKYIGDCLAVQTPRIAYQTDPLIAPTLVPSSIQEWAVDLTEIKRYMRLYMPRSSSHLVGGTDVVMLSNSAADYFQPSWLTWIADGTEDPGLGLVMVGGLSSFGGFNGYVVYPDWGQTQVGRILPVEMVTVEGDGHKDFTFRLVPSAQDEPLVTSFDWDRGPLFFSLNTVSARPGARVIATSRPEELVLLAYQDVGKGSSLAFTTTWGNPWGNEFFRWEFFPDFCADLVYHSAGIEIPNPVVVHEIRILFEEHYLAQDVVRSIVDFADRMGGRTTRVQKLLDDLDSSRGRVDGLYIEQAYEACIGEMEALLLDLDGVAEEAIQAKNAAFLWIYVIEWSGVTATLFLSGYFLYAVMIRRRLYKQVGMTQAT
jgi:predicted DNA-binding protein